MKKFMRLALLVVVGVGAVYMLRSPSNTAGPVQGDVQHGLDPSSLLDTQQALQKLQEQEKMLLAQQTKMGGKTASAASAKTLSPPPLPAAAVLPPPLAPPLAPPPPLLGLPLARLPSLSPSPPSS